MTDTVPFGPEFLVNTTTKNAQWGPAVAGLANGRFVVVWTDYSRSRDDKDDAAVRAQVFNANGTKAGAEFLVNTTTTAAQREAAATALDDGGFVITWSDQSGSGGETIRGQMFDPKGARSGGEFKVPAAIGDENGSSLAARAHGGFVAVWTETSEGVGDHSGAAIHAQFFGPGGAPSGEEIHVNTTTLNAQYSPSVASLANGKTVMVWTDTSKAGDGVAEMDIRARMFNVDGTPVDLDFVASAATAGIQVFADVTALAGGSFVVAWTHSAEAIVRAQVFDGEGHRTGDEFTLGKSDETMRVLPKLAALPNGGFVASWTDYDAAGSGQMVIFAQVFGADGEPQADEFKVMRHADGGAYEQSVAALADGRFVVSWSSAILSGHDKDTSSIHARIFDPRDEAIHLSGTGGNDDFVGTGFADTLSGKGGRDRLSGGDGADRLNGGTGKDVLIGGDGKDAFLFTDALSRKNVDRIADFDRHDQLYLLADLFEGVGAKLAGGAFVAASGAHEAHDRNDRIIYDTKSGSLFYDADGSGGQAAVRFAILDHAPTLSASDFAIVA